MVEVSCFTTTADAINTTEPCRVACDDTLMLGQECLNRSNESRASTGLDSALELRRVE